MAPRTVVAPVARTPLPFGLFSAVTLRPDGADRWEVGTLTESGTCAPVDNAGRPRCVDGEWVGGSSLPKDLDPNAAPFGEADPFLVYGHYTCSPAAGGLDAAQDRAEEHLVTREEAAVEAAFWTGDADNAPSLQDADTETVVAGPVSGVAGVGALEDFIARTYGSQGVLHMTRSMALALLADKVLDHRGGRLVTQLGTPVVAGAGYPGTGPAGEAVTGEQSWVYVTPAVYGYRSEIITSSQTLGDLMDRTNNVHHAIAERLYLLGFDPCGVGAVLIDPTL